VPFASCLYNIPFTNPDLRVTYGATAERIGISEAGSGCLTETSSFGAGEVWITGIGQATSARRGALDANWDAIVRDESTPR